MDENEKRSLEQSSAFLDMQKFGYISGGSGIDPYGPRSGPRTLPIEDLNALLKEENKRLREALEPFAEMAKAMAKATTADGKIYMLGRNPRPFEILPDGRAAVSFEHFLKASEALKTAPSSAEASLPLPSSE